MTNKLLPAARGSAPDMGVRTHLPIPVLLYLIAVAVPVHFYLGSLRLTGVRVLLLLLIIPMVINLLKGKYGRILWVDYLFFLHFFWICVALAINNPAEFTQQVGSIGIEFIGGYMLGRAYIRDIKSFGGLCRLLVLIACCTLPFAIHEALTGKTVILDAIRGLPGLTSVDPMTDDWYNRKRFGLYRTQVFAAHPILYGFFCASAFPLAWIAFKNLYGNTVRYISIGLVGACVFFSLSSGALVAVVLQLGLVFWAWVFDRVAKRWVILAGLFLAGYVTVDILSNRPPLIVLVSYLAFNPATAYGRAIIFEQGMMNVWANPIFGLGLNDWTRIWWMSATVDNFWLVIAMRYGIPGFALLALGYVITLVQVGRRRFDNDRRLWLYRRAWMISFVGLSVTLATVHVWGTMYSFTFFLFGAGAWFITAVPQAENDTGDQTEQKAVRSVPYTRFNKIGRGHPPISNGVQS